jgi:hypothetical protein
MTAPLPQVYGDGHWLSAERVKLYAAAVLFAQALMIALLMLKAPQGFAVTGNDFRVFWAASSLALQGDGAGAYDIARLFPIQQSVAPLLETPKAWHYWFYPPTFLLAVLPLALLPYYLSFVLFNAAGLAIYLRVVYAIVPRREAVIAALAFPAVAVTVFNGQNSLITASLAALVLILLDRRPRLAGIVLGLLAIKPHLVPLFVLALACARRWHTLAYAACTALGLVLASLLVFSPQAGLAFLDGIQLAKAFAEHGQLPLEKMPTVFASARLGGLGAAPANWLHGLAALAVALVVARLWWRGAPAHLRNSALIVGCMLFSPHLFDYDLAWLAWPIAWFSAHAMRHGWQRGERELLLLVWAAPLAGDVLARTSFHLWPVIGLVLLSQLARRAGSGTAASSPCPVSIPGQLTEPSYDPR